MSPLYLVATPIGNREDITLRALRLLQTAAVIAAEDTRRARRLLALYEITPPPLVSLREHNEAQASARLIARLAQGRDDEHAVYLTDAGTPGISDPGARLVATARARGAPVIPIPGASALTALLAVAGVPQNPAASAVHFYGFVPAAVAKRTAMFRQWKQVAGWHVFFDAPHRVAQTLSNLREALGGSCRCVVGRELTKRHEQIIDATLDNIISALEDGTLPTRGEWTLLVDIPQASAAETIDPHALFDRLRAELPPRRAAAIAAAFSHHPASHFYQRHLQKK